MLVGTDVGDGAGEGGFGAGVLGSEEAVHVEGTRGSRLWDFCIAGGE